MKKKRHADSTWERLKQNRQCFYSVFASQTSHFWQLGGVMQAKMRSLLRLLVKSIIEDRKRQADATAAREAHHSASPAADPSAQKTQDTGTS